MRFKNWLIEENFAVDIPTALQIPKTVNYNQQPISYFTEKEFNHFIKPILNNYFRGNLREVLQRYTVKIESISNQYEFVIEFELSPRGKGEEEAVSPDDPMYDYYQKFKDGKTGWREYKTPKDAINSIPEDDNLVYRGMSWGEWQFIQKSGYIQSNAGYNLGDKQLNLTFYGNAKTAIYYANGFAPMQFKVGIKTPGVIIAIPKNLVMTNKDRPGAIPGGEFAHEGSLDSKHIRHAWMLVPNKVKSGSFEIRFEWRRQKEENGNYSNDFYLSNPKEGSSHHPSILTAVRKII